MLLSRHVTCLLASIFVVYVSCVPFVSSEDSDDSHTSLGVSTTTDPTTTSLATTTSTGTTTTIVTTTVAESTTTSMETTSATAPLTGTPYCVPSPELPDRVVTQWSECTRTCGGGVQTGMTFVTRDGYEDVCKLSFHAPCNRKPCIDPFEGVTWSDCSAPCGGGTRHRQSKTEPFVVQEIPCNTQPCEMRRAKCESDIVFLLHSSESDFKWFHQKQFVIDVVQRLVKGNEVNTHIGVISFSTMVRTDISLGQYTDTSELVSAIWDIEFLSGDNFFNDAIWAIKDMFDQDKRPETKAIAVLLVDDLYPQELELRLARAFVNNGTAIYVIHTRKNDDIDTSRIASDPSLVYNSENLDIVETLSDSLFSMACNNNPKPTPQECYMCDFTRGQIWLQDIDNCHMFYVCEKIDDYQYRKHHMTCGDLWWHQDIHTCVRDPPEACNVTAPVKQYVPPTTSEVPCPYEPVPDANGHFRLIGIPAEKFRCVEGMVFSTESCSCVVEHTINPTCSDDLLLHFPFDDHYNDVTCHGAVATQYGDGVERTFDAMRRTNVACFSGKTYFEIPFLRTWFANNHVDKFSISVFVLRHGELWPRVAIVDNNNCKQPGGFSLWASKSFVAGSITTNATAASDSEFCSDDNEWHHAAWVYNGNTLKVYVDGISWEETYCSGYLLNNDEPMHIGYDCYGNYFIGCLDELRVYNRALSEKEVKHLMLM